MSRSHGHGMFIMCKYMHTNMVTVNFINNNRHTDAGSQRMHHDAGTHKSQNSWPSEGAACTGHGHGHGHGQVTVTNRNATSK